MIIYSSVSHPLDNAVRMVLYEKEVEMDLRFVNKDDENIPDDVRRNPYNAILTLSDRNLILYDGQIIMEYLEERYPHPQLMPMEPAKRAYNRQIRYRVMDSLYSEMDKVMYSGNDLERARAKEALRDYLSSMARRISQKQFFDSNEMSLVDCCLAPLFLRLNHYEIKLPATAQQNWFRYCRRLFKTPSFLKSLTEQEREMLPPPKTRKSTRKRIKH